MKTIVKILLLLVISLQMNCQILPLKTFSFDVPNGGYLKDLDNVLPYWEGTWKGTADNKEYTFQFVFFPHQLIVFSSERSYYVDKLVAKFKVKDLTTNNILYDDLGITNFEDYKIKLGSYTNFNGYMFYSQDDDAHCSNMVSFTLVKNNPNLNQATYTAFEYNSYIDFDCPYNDQLSIPLFLPTTNLVLTKQ